ncbi:MAG: hypothetical protein ACKPBU_15075 [Alphaproteobacteria bacterium]
MFRATRGPLLAILLSCLALQACPNGQSRIIPPAPTAAPGAGATWFYVAEANAPGFETFGGALSAYRVGDDGLLPADPVVSIPVVGARRVVKHPELPVLYVAGANQVFAFDITDGEPVSLCGPSVTLAPPCATDPAFGSNPLDITFAKSRDTWFLYLTEGGRGQSTDYITRLAAYPLGDRGELPGQATSEVSNFNSTNYRSAQVYPDIRRAYIADTGSSVIWTYQLSDDGNLPEPPSTPVPIGGTPTPTPTPTPAISATPSPSPTAVCAWAPGRMATLERPTDRECPAPAVPAASCPTPIPGGEKLLYVVQVTQKRMSVYYVPSDPALSGYLQKNPQSESNTRSPYNAFVFDPCGNHVYGAAYTSGQIDVFAIDEYGCFVDGPESSSFSDPTSYPTGIAWATLRAPGGGLRDAVLVSVGGLDRVDAYGVTPDGTIDSRPFSSTGPRKGTFPADIATYVPAP